MACVCTFDSPFEMRVKCNANMSLRVLTSVPFPRSVYELFWLQEGSSSFFKEGEAF